MYRNLSYLVRTLVNNKVISHLSSVNHQVSTFSFTTMKIGTHDGIFHCDEVLACFMLRQLPQYKDAEIVRTRDQAKLHTCDIVVDVGAVFNHQQKRYDHHQREFIDTLSSLRPELGDKYKIRLSSAGLVYTYYGEEVIKELLLKGTTLPPADLKIVYKKIYENLIEEIDALDNGVPMTDGEPRYKIQTHLGSRVGRLNPEWNSNQHINPNERFTKAMELVGEEFMYHFNYITTVWLPARVLVKQAIENRFKTHDSGKIVEFSECFPWQEHLFDLEKEMGIEQQVQYVLFSSESQSWRVRAVPMYASSFVTRKPLNKNWWGINGEELSNIAGIPDCIFCHSTGFIGGNKTKDGALKMAIASLQAA